MHALQVVEDGYEFFAKRQLVTIFSAPNYCGEFDNAGAMMSVDETLMCSFQVSLCALCNLSRAALTSWIACSTHIETNSSWVQQRTAVGGVMCTLAVQHFMTCTCLHERVCGAAIPNTCIITCSVQIKRV